MKALEGTPAGRARVEKATERARRFFEEQVKQYDAEPQGEQVGVDESRRREAGAPVAATPPHYDDVEPVDDALWRLLQRGEGEQSEDEDDAQDAGMDLGLVGGPDDLRAEMTRLLTMARCITSTARRWAVRACRVGR